MTSTARASSIAIGSVARARSGGPLRHAAPLVVETAFACQARRSFLALAFVENGFACQARRSFLALAFVENGFACQARRSFLALAFGDVTWPSSR